VKRAVTSRLINAPSLPANSTTPCRFQNTKSTLNLNNLKPFRNDLLDIFILVLQRAERECNIVPLPLRIAPLQSRRKLVSELFSMFVLNKEALAVPF
jgi:hypothetical protein